MASTDSGLSENVAGFLCYLVGWITGLIFFLIVLRIVLAMLFGISLFGGGLGWTGFTFGWLLFSLIGLVALILWIVLMVKAYQGERFKVPIAGDLAESFAGK